jgi:hypothetical protein
MKWKSAKKATMKWLTFISRKEIYNISPKIQGKGCRKMTAFFLINSQTLVSEKLIGDIAFYLSE